LTTKDPTLQDDKERGPVPGRPISGQGLAAATATLARALKESGSRVGLKGLLDALRAAALVGVESEQDLRFALKANLVASQDEAEIFDRLFDRIFLRGEAEKGPRGIAPEAAGLGASCLIPETGREEPEGTLPLSPSSPAEVLFQRDLRHLAEGEAEPALAVLDSLLAGMLTRPSRRLKPGGRRGRVDFRRSWRQSISLGGEIFSLPRLKPRIKNRRLVLMLDVSGSMEIHTRFLLHFARLWLKARPGQVEVFAFSTRLRRLTGLLADRSLEAALGEIGRVMPEWAGGTRIGQAVQELLTGPGRGAVNSSTVVAVVSDGWDRGDIPFLKRQMERLSFRARRVVWLNPLLATPGYEPLCAGMAAALPHVDRFLPAHSVESLIQAAETFKEMLVQ